MTVLRYNEHLPVGRPGNHISLR